MKTEFTISYFFWMKRKLIDGRTPVYIRSKQNSGKQISFNTGVKLLGVEWNSKKNKPKFANDRLSKLEKDIQATYRDLMSQGFNPDLSLILRHLSDVRKPTSRSVSAWCTDYIAGPYSHGQKKSVKTLQSNLDSFNKALSFDDLTKTRLKDFFNFLTKKGVANNSAYKRLRALINVASHADLDIPPLTNYELPYSTANALRPRLTWPEVKAIMNTEPINHLEQVGKDAFLLACFSGLRISDILTLHRGELHDFHYERLQTKTKQPVLVTVHKYNAELFKRYIAHGVGYTRQTLSGALKNVLERSGLTKKIIKIQAVGNLFKETVSPKFKEISFHSGRRFYARLLSDLSLGSEITRDELGHSFKNVTELYSGSQDHAYRVNRVRKAMEGLEGSMEQLDAMMRVA